MATKTDTRCTAAKDGKRCVKQTGHAGRHPYRAEGWNARCPYCRSAIRPDGLCSSEKCRAQPGPTAGAVAEAVRKLKKEMEGPAFQRAVNDMARRDEAAIEAMPDDRSTWEDCRSCRGMGRIAEDDRTSRECTDCRGEGTVPPRPRRDQL